jgi:hypothetical protein
MRLVILESPYAGDIARNEAYARAAMADCLRRGDSPMCSHLLYTQPGVLRDDVPEERALGINAGLAWGRVAEATVVYEDLGILRGMRAGIARAEAEGRPVEYRRLGGEWAHTNETEGRSFRMYYGLATGCHAGSDGECSWKECPQLRDGEPDKSGRHCPLDVREDD